MALTYDCIATTTIYAERSEVTFSSIPSSFTDLMLVCSGSQTVATNVNMRLNGDTGNNYSDTGINASISSASSNRNSNQPYFWLGPWDTVFIGAQIYHIQNYTNTTVNKSVLCRNASSGYATNLTAGLWRSTSAITSVSIFPNTGNFKIGSMFSLYGIKAA